MRKLLPKSTGTLVCKNPALLPAVFFLSFIISSHSNVFGKKLSHSFPLYIAQTLPGVYTFLLRKMLHFHKYSKIFVYNTQNTIIEI